MGKNAKAPRESLIVARKERLWSQQELASLLGTTQHNISRWEQGATTPSPYFSKKLCELFGKSAQELGLFSESAANDGQLPADRRGSDPSQAPLTPVDQSSSLWAVPYPRNPFFTGREEFLRHLHKMLRQERTMALTQSWAISGLGGIGKTQIALEYVYRYASEYRCVFWTNAATQETLFADFVTIADHLQLPERHEPDQKKVLSAVKHWLSTHHEWLFILDNADDVTLVRDVVPPDSPGHLLLTSRAQALGSLAQRLEVEKMGLGEGTLFLLHRAKVLAPEAFLDHASEKDLAAAETIVIEMDFLPLALDQAGAYIEEVGCSLSTYLELYRTHRRELLQRRGSLSSDHPESVATTWSLSFQKIEQANPAAAEVLRLCAFLEPDTIPEELFHEANVDLGPVLQSITADVLALNKAIEELRKFSLLQHDSHLKLVRLHRLVQAVLKDVMKEGERRQWAERAVRATNAAFPQSVQANSWSDCQRYLPQAQICVSLIQDYAFTFGEVASLLFRTASYLYDHALYEQAEPLFLQALQIGEQSLGPDHPDLAAPLNGLAALYCKYKKYAEAEPLFRRALRIREQNLGLHHLDVARSLDRLGSLFGEQGKYEEAEPLFQQALQIWEQGLGPDHPDLAAPLDGLAIIFAQEGKYAEAEPLFQRALSIRERTLNPDHPDIAASLNNLASFYQNQGKCEQAEPLYQRTLQIWEQRLGPEHLYVAYPLDGLAEVYSAQGKYEEAERLFQRALHIWEQTLGPEDPDVAYALHRLARLYSQQKRYKEADLLFQRAWRIYEQTLDEFHLDRAELLHDLAVFKQAQGKCREAALWYQRALAIREQVLGPDHQHTVETQTKYVALLQTLGREKEAVSSEKGQAI